MPRRPARLAILVALVVWQTAACSSAQAAGPFPDQVITRPRERSHTWSYLTLGAGVGAIGASFLLAERGNDTYDDYLAATDPASIEDLYDRAARYDRFASTSLITGEVLLAAGLYLRFLRRPAPLLLSIGPERCAVALRF